MTSGTTPNPPESICLTCPGRLLAPGEFDPSDAVGYYPQDREAGYILPCTGKPRSNVRMRTHAQTEMRAHRKGPGLPAPIFLMGGRAAEMPQTPSEQK